MFENDEEFISLTDLGSPDSKKQNKGVSVSFDQYVCLGDLSHMCNIRRSDMVKLVFELGLKSCELVRKVLTDEQLLQGIQASNCYQAADYPPETILRDVEILRQEPKAQRMFFQGTCLVQLPDSELTKASFSAEVLSDRRFRVTSFEPVGS